MSTTDQVTIAVFLLLLVLPWEEHADVNLIYNGSTNV